MDVNEELKFGENSKKKIKGGWRVGAGVGLRGGQGGCERRIEVFVKIQKKNIWGGGGSGEGGSGGGVGWEGGQGGCDRRMEVFGKVHKKNIGGSGGSGGSGWM